MSDVLRILTLLRETFALEPAQLSAIASAFQEEMRRGLSGQPCSLAMLPSFLTCPTGQEKGSFLALDFGGTNVRALVVDLLGDGHLTIRSHTALPLVDPNGAYNHIDGSATADGLFGFLAQMIERIAPGKNDYPLGLTFSYPCRQTAADNSVLISWTKEIQTSGVEGQEVVGLLRSALKKRDLTHIRPVAVLNDTVSALLAAAYAEPAARIGSICGTGHNTCYLEPNPRQSAFPMYVNMESGNYDKLPFNPYDDALDKASDKPGAGRLEKMSSGRYIGELVRLSLMDAADRGWCFNDAQPGFLRLTDSISGADLAIFLSDSTQELDEIGHWLDQNGLSASRLEDRHAIRHTASHVVRRSAQLVAMTYAATLTHIDPGHQSKHVIAIDGSLYEKMPGYAGTIEETLGTLLGDFAKQVNLRLSKDGSGIGAAVAAATIHE